MQFPMMIGIQAVDLLLIGASIALGVLGLPLMVECLVAGWPSRRRPTPAQSRRPSAQILIPARNEADILPSTLSALNSELTAGDRVWVIADNCTDNTAEVARSAGAEVIERYNEVERGKGFALQHAIDLIEPAAGSVAVIVDADCHFEPGGLAKIVRLAEATQQPVQSCYRMLDTDPHPRVRLSQFAVLLRNTVRQRGLSQLGLPGLLSGSGMAFPWAVLHAANLANDNTADDLQLTCDLAIAGHSVRFCEEAVIIAMLPSDPDVATVQRKRWIHGHLRTAVRYVPRLLWAGLTKRRLGPIVVAMEVAVPPLSLLVLIHAALGIACMIWGALSGNWWPAVVSMASVTLFVAAIGLAWISRGREVLPWRSVRALPSHIIRTLIASMELPFRRQHWTPTRRDVTTLPHDG